MLEAWITSNWQKRGLLAWLLLPLSWLYTAITSIRRCLYRHSLWQQYAAPVPVVVVGNIYVGGTGKTPVILSLITALRERGWHPGLVSRGYGSISKNQPVCGQGLLDAQVFGDEPSMISHKTQVPVSVHPSRATACQALLQFDPSINVILSDDGLQHWQLQRDIEIIVQDERGCGNGFVLPAGPLREPKVRLTQVNAILTRSLPEQLSQPVPNTSVLQCRFAVQVQTFVHLQSGTTMDASTFASHLNHTPNRHKDSTVTHFAAPAVPVLAMAGIGVPERFFRDLRAHGIQPARSLPLPDHGAITAKWIAELPERTILMTEKDAARLIHTYSRPVDQPVPMAEIDLATTNPSGDRQLLCPNADPRIWIGVAATLWQNDSFFDWLDRQLHQLPRC